MTGGWPFNRETMPLVANFGAVAALKSVQLKAEVGAHE